MDEALIAGVEEREIRKVKKQGNKAFKNSNRQMEIAAEAAREGVKDAIKLNTCFS